MASSSLNDSIGTTSTITGQQMADAEISTKTISSPHELTDWVDGLLDTLQSRFETMQSKVEERMTEMARRIDSLENGIEELIQGQTSASNNVVAGTQEAR